MPFKLRLRKTRHYNVLSRNVLVLSVELIDKTTLECTLSSDSTGLECLHNVCQRLGLQQPEFFGLRYMSKRPYPKVRWVELDRPLKKQLDKYAQSPALSLAVQYYIHDVGLLQDDVTRSHYFLQVKQDVLEGRLRSNYEQAVLLASYSLQAEFGDHQPERHTPEYLKDFRLFPKQAVSEGEMASLLEAVVWQYSSLAGLAQALAETYYILEAQRLPGYGQETFIARDEKGCEVYLGASLLGIVVQPASGEIQTFYRWNDITNLINHKRNFGIECSRSDETVQFTFEEPDAAKYVWKMCVKQHTFYKGNQDLLEGGGVMETRSLAIPDLQSSVMASSGKLSQHPSSSSREMVKMDGRISDISIRDDHINSRALTASLPHLDLSFTPKKSSENTTLGSTMESSATLGNHESFGLMSQSLFSLNTSRFSIKQPHHLHESPYGHQDQMTPNKHGEIKPLDGSSRHLAIYSSGRNSSSKRNSARRNLLPQYRPTPDYETALIQKYGSNMSSQVQSLLYSSQPEISHHVPEHLLPDSREREGGMPSYKHYTDFDADQQRLLPVTQALHNTYSSPELAQNNLHEEVETKRRIEACHIDYHFIHGYKPPPPYPYSKPSSNSTPDLASTFKCEEKTSEMTWRKRPSQLTASLGCLGSPELSRTYENLTDLSDAVESLRKELTKGGESTFLHSFAPNYSTDGLDAIYQLSNGHVAVGQNLNLKVGSADQPSSQRHITSSCDAAKLIEEPIYQNVEVLLSERREDGRERAKSAPEVEGVNKASKKSSHSEHLTRLLSVTALSAANIETPPTPVGVSWLPHNPQYVPENIVPPETKLNVQQLQQGNVVNKSIVAVARLPHMMMPKQETCNILVSPQTNTMQEKDAANIIGSKNLCAKKDTKKPDLISETYLKDPKTAELESKMASLDIVHEYESTPRVKPNADYLSASRPENVPRNRYKDILPYEENRVKITPNKDNKTGYINASHITASVGESQKFYICAQGPLASTVGHFWQCIWETDVRLIVMLASVVGDTQTSKSFPYWPQSDNTSVECDQFRIYRKQSTESGSHVTCRLQLVHVGQRKSRAVWHLQYTDWADHGCPQDTQAFINFLQELSTLRRVTYREVEGVGRNRNTPVLVHCSAGVGRSGVTIMCDLLLEAADHNLPIDPPKLLRHLRQQRMAIVQSSNQYKFIYKVIISYLQKARLI